MAAASIHRARVAVKRTFVPHDRMRCAGLVADGMIALSYAFGGLLYGRTLDTVPGRLIVQAWRSANFRKSDVDSTLILRFMPMGRKGRIVLTHVNVPDHDHRGVTNGWKKYYWRPWRKFLASR